VALVQDNEFQIEFLEHDILFFDHAIASYEQLRPLGFFLFGDLADFLFVVENDDLADRVREVFSVLKGPVLHESGGANYEAMRVFCRLGIIEGVLVLIFKYNKSLKGLA
jgi:hypothetical protein